MEFADGLGRGRFDRVGHREDSSRLAIDRDEHRGLALLLKLPGRDLQRFQAGDLFVPQEIRFTNQNRAASDDPGNTACRYRAKVLHGRKNDALLLRAMHNRGGQRVFTVLLQ